MKINELLEKYPNSRIKAIDGMAVTADVWQKAHDYHLDQGKFHNLATHGAGILTGLDVLASDPTDSTVYIVPGVAIDGDGQIIVLSEPLSYDLGDELDGEIYLFLGYAESNPRADKKKNDDNLYVFDEFSLAARTSESKGSMIEIARLNRKSKTATIKNAENALHPGVNEIDLRHRRMISMTTTRRVRIAVSYLGEVNDKKQGLGLGKIANEVSHTGDYQVIVDNDLPFEPSVLSYDVIYLVGGGAFKLSAAEVKGLGKYIERGGFVFAEAIDDDAAKTFEKHFKTMKAALKSLDAEHPLMSAVHYFSTAPEGMDEGDVLGAKGLVFSQRNYGLLWSSNGALSREATRTAVEWVTNIVAYSKKS